MTSPTLASAPGDCCVAGFQHTGIPTGTTFDIAGVNTYVAEPKGSSSGGKKVILFFADIYSPVYLNNQLIQDYFSRQGFTVLGPDYFFGDPIQNHANEEGFNRPAWVAKSKKQAEDHLPGWIEAVKQKYGTTETKYCAVGYCFGAPYALNLGATDFLAATAFAHPAFLDESHIEKVKAPVLISCAEDDFAFPVEARHRAESILTKNKSQFHIQVFSGVSHGFASKGDPEDPAACWAKEESARGMVSWFERFAGSG